MNVVTRPLVPWGRVHQQPERVVEPHERPTALAPLIDGPAAGSVLAWGHGRSYGDSNLNPGGLHIAMRGVARVIDFDAETGVVTAEAGLLLSELLALVVPHGWFVPVTPGTQFVTLGGALANDVHGKNHHVAGSFGRHVLAFELLRSDGSCRTCTPAQHVDLFGATVGGLGLTGLITWVRLQLMRVASDRFETETLRFPDLDGFFALSDASAADWPYTASWIDCAGRGRRLGRGVFERGRHASREQAGDAPVPARAVRTFPFVPPVSLVNTWSLQAFNLLYYHRAPATPRRSVRPYQPFLYPLDNLLEWNRMYGPRGFYQYQCVVPPADAPRVIARLLETIAASGMGSFLAVLKQFGDVPSPGWLSFPMPGTTLALDFPNRGAALHDLFARLDRIVLDAGGRLYPAKDGRMDSPMFRAGYPRWREFAETVDPRFSSAFWRRVHPV